MVWTIYTFSLIPGGIFLYFVLGDTSTDNDNISIKTTRILYGSFATVGFLANVTLIMLQPVNDKNRKQNDKITLQSFLSEMGSTARTMLRLDVLILSISFAFTGIELAFWNGVYSTSLGFTKAFNMNRHKLVALNAIAVGIGQLSVGTLIGVLGPRAHRHGNYPIIIVGTIAGLVSYGLIYINLPDDAPLDETYEKGIIKPSITLALISGALMGLADCCWNTQIYAFLSIVYSNEGAQVFAIHKFFHAILAAASFYYSGHIGLHWQLVILSIGALLAGSSFIGVELWNKRRRRLKEGGRE